MAAKTKLKKKTNAKPITSIKKVAHKPLPSRKPLVSSKKAAKPSKTAKKTAPPPKKTALKTPKRKTSVVVRKSGPKAEVRKPAKSRESHAKPVPVQKPRSKEYGGAVHAYEAGLKLMHAEEYARAIKAFRELIGEHVDEPEIQERARVLLHASEKKLQEKARLVFRSADDHYNAGIGDLNRRHLDGAIEHFQNALKLAPKADHVLYAMAAANALKGNRDEALSFLKLAIQQRVENRFMAARDSDFESLGEDPDFKLLVTSSEK